MKLAWQRRARTFIRFYKERAHLFFIYFKGIQQGSTAKYCFSTFYGLFSWACLARSAAILYFDKLPLSHLIAGAASSRAPEWFTDARRKTYKLTGSETATNLCQHACSKLLCTAPVAMHTFTSHFIVCIFVFIKTLAFSNLQTCRFTKTKAILNFLDVKLSENLICF